MVKPKIRLSGSQMQESCAFTIEKDGIHCLDINAVQALIQEFQDDAEESGQYSIARLCLKLDITREALGLWRKGYVNEQDAHDTHVLPNEALAHCIEMGILHIERHWEECDKSSLQSKYVKMLEESGALGGKSDKTVFSPFDLGSYKKYSK